MVSGQGPHILYLEDDESVLSITTSMLEHLGCTGKTGGAENAAVTSTVTDSEGLEREEGSSVRADALRDAEEKDADAVPHDGVQWSICPRESGRRFVCEYARPGNTVRVQRFSALPFLVQQLR
jgi:hypothetical protein